MYKLDLADGYDAQRAILTAKLVPHTSRMLCKYLATAGAGLPNNFLPVFTFSLSQWSEEQFAEQFALQVLDVVSSSGDSAAMRSVDALDRMPFHMWKQGNREFRIGGSVYRERAAILRRCGYVMWDFQVESVQDVKDKLAQLSRMEQSQMYTVLSTEEQDRIRHSRQERRRMFDGGERGYWQMMGCQRARGPSPGRGSGGGVANIS